MFAGSGPPLSAGEQAKLVAPEPEAAQTLQELGDHTSLQEPAAGALGLIEQSQRTLASEYESSQAAANRDIRPVDASQTREVLDQRLRALGLPTPIGGAITSSVESSPTPEAADEACEPHAGGLYCVYTVSAGDTMSVIAARYGITGSGDLSPAEMLAESNKPHVTDAESITPGLKIRIPAQNGIIHTVYASETLNAVASTYGVTAADIQSVALNDVADGILTIGQEILVPDPAYVSHPAPPEQIAGLTSAEEEPAEEAEPEIEALIEEEPTATLVPEDTATPEPEDTATPEPVADTPTPEATATATATAEATATATPVAVAGQFNNGERVYVEGDSCLNVREFPGLNQEILDCLDQGTRITLATGPVEADGYLWYQAEGSGGWVVEDYLTDTRPAATPTPAPKATATARPSQPSSSGFIWPASGPISSYFGPSHPLGIDIDFYSDPNQAVGAAAAGTVTFAGGDPCCSYGYYVIVDHGDGWTTLYGHFSKISVSVGERVSQGELLGYGGNTGNSTGNHLHFEMHNNGSIVDPLLYLP